MTSDPEEVLNDELRLKLRELAKSPEVPANLEEATVGSLRIHGFLRSGVAPKQSGKWWMIAAAACLLFLATGFLLGRRAARSPISPQGNQYVLFLNLPENSSAPDANDEAQIVKEYSFWARQQRAAGHLIDGEKLNEDATELSAPGGPAQKRSSVKMAAGFFVIVARTFDEAVAIARTCPHLRHGGSIVIRPVDPTP